MKAILLTTALIISSLFLLKAQTYSLPFGVSLCGAEFGTNSLPGKINTDYIYPDKNEIAYFARKGVTVMQLPIRWERIQKSVFAPLDNAELNRIKTFIGDCAAQGVFVVLNIHNFGRYKINNEEFIIGTKEVPVSAFKDLWKKLSLSLNVFNNIYAFDIMNEPHDMGSNSWFTAAQEAIKGIRENNKQVYIMVEGESYSNAAKWVEFNDGLKYLQDASNRIVFNAHCYFDEDFSGRYVKNYDQTKVNVNTGVNYVRPFVEWLKENNKKGYVGEFGVPNDDARWLTVLDNFLGYLTTNGISGSYWAAGPWWKNYPLSLHPTFGKDQPQMNVYAKYLQSGVAANF